MSTEVTLRAMYISIQPYEKKGQDRQPQRALRVPTSTIIIIDLLRDSSPKLVSPAGLGVRTAHLHQHSTSYISESNNVLHMLW